MWRDFHEYWRTQDQAYFLRFEDLLSDPQQTLTGVFEYLLGVDSIEGTEIEA